MKQKQKYILASFFLGLFIIETIGILNHYSIINNFDNFFFTILQSHNVVVTNIFSIISTFGSPMISIILTILFAFLVWIYKSKPLAIWILATQFIGSLVAEIVKSLVHRERPDLQLLPNTGFSFPSGHVFCTTILTLCVISVFLKYTKDQKKDITVIILGIIWISLVAVSRVYLRNHFATDVLASILLSCGLWLLMSAFQNKFISLITNKKQQQD